MTASRSDHHIIELPAIRGLLRHAGWHIVEAVVIPMATFYLLLSVAGLTAALVVALVWTYGSIIRRLVIGERVPAILVLGTLLFTVRCVIAFMTNSVFLYFLQPTLGTYLVAALFLLSVPLGKPLAQRLAHDFCPLPDSLLGRATMQRYFLRLSLMWALVYTVNASATLFLLLTQSTGTFMLLKSFSPVLTGTAVVVSYLWFRRSMRSENVVLQWGSPVGAAPQPAAVEVAVAGVAQR